MKKYSLSILCILLIITRSYGQSTLIGMTNWGYSSVNTGTIFTLNTGDTVIANQYNFVASGYNPQADLCQATNGKLYGMTKMGGASNLGVLFEFNLSSNSYKTMVNFSGSTSGSYPYGSLILASNGKMYGMTSSGGTSNNGVLFEFDPASGSYAKKVDFAGGTDGRVPRGSLMQASNGKLYGMTEYGGTTNKGILFEFDPVTGTYTKKVDFAGTSNGQNPTGSLMQTANDKIYGMTKLGGVHNKGIIFEYDCVANVVTKFHDFDGIFDGSLPTGSLIQAADGTLYGLTNDGGTSDEGIIFAVDTAGLGYSKLHDITGPARPYGSLVQAPNGKLYGLGNIDGTLGAGGIFEFDPISSVFTNLYSFDITSNVGFPFGSLMLASNGKLYGMTEGGGGTTYPGILFEYDPATLTYAKKFRFSSTAVGRNPKGDLIRASNGKLYGMTEMGGAIDVGVLFEYDVPTNSVERKFDFDGPNGKNPTGSLLEASNGKLYGLTSLGGATNEGVLFEFDPVTGIFVKKKDFGGIYGGNPAENLMQASNGKLYGMTPYDSPGGFGGTIFEYDITTNTLTTKYSFTTDWNMGRAPYGSLIEVSPGKLYGLSSRGGLGWQGPGVIFEYDFITNIYTKKIDFNYPPYLFGGDPQGSLLKASNGKLYGMTQHDGMSAGSPIGPGLIFDYDPATNIMTNIHDFDCISSGDWSGWSPRGTLIQAYNGKLYGLCSYTQSTYDDCDRLFEYDITTNTYTNKIGFTNTLGLGYGAHPYGSLLEYGAPPPSSAGVNHIDTKEKMNIFPNPSSGIYTIQIVNPELTTEPYRLSVLNIMGEEIFSTDGTQMSNTIIDLSEYANGVYFINVTSEKSSISKKIILNK